MSDNIFPDLALGGEFIKAPRFNTKILKSVNGRELRASYQATPIYEITLQIPVMDEKIGDLKVLEDFFIARRGAFDSFLFKMPWDDEYDCTFIGDGTTVTFQLYKDLSPLGNTQPQVAFDANPTFWNEDDNQQFWSDNDDELFWDDTKITVSKSGIVQATKPLKAGHKFSVKGLFYYRCRFADDVQAFTLFSYRLWKGEVTLIGSLGNRI